jgi:hypothetical protein
MTSQTSAAEGILYHVTTRLNVRSIGEHGIDPSFSLGRLPQCWYVTPNKCLWALSHVSARHSVAVDDLVIAVVPYGQHFRRTHLKEVYTCSSVVQPIDWLDAREFIMLQADEERLPLD